MYSWFPGTKIYIHIYIYIYIYTYKHNVIYWCFYISLAHMDCKPFLKRDHPVSSTVSILKMLLDLGLIGVDK